MTGGPGKIHVLPADVAGRIAAGEVVERPAAVVRELIDNSLDAGAAKITVEVTDSGLGVIRVTDDGEGMTKDDARLAFQRHATSKLRSERDLWAITTLGFRGEALPSIAAVSNINLVTARRQDSIGTRLVATGGVVTKVEEAAAAPGTQIEVADLFYNTPARKKFLKSKATEFSHICQAVQQAALAWPLVHVRLRHNGQDVSEYAAAASWKDRALQVYGAGALKQFLEIRGERAGVRLEGLAVDPNQTRAARTPQDLFVNRRAVKNPTVAHAIYDGYGAALAKGRHPRYVLFLEVDPGRVDVNVHPAKREVRFADQDLVHQVVRQAVHSALGGPQTEPAGPGTEPVSWGETSRRPSPAPYHQWTAVGGEQARLHLTHGQPEPSKDGAGHAGTASEAAVPYAAGPSGAFGWEVVPLGQIARTFLIAQVGPELQVIDQHTAHERVLFERLWRAWTSQTVASQPLLISEPIELPPDRASLLQRHLADLEKLGLAIEPFGTSAFVIRAVPALLGHLDYGSLVQDLLEDLSEWSSTSSLDARVRPVLASLACHGAVRAGRGMELAESRRLIEEWVGEGLPMTCPHGRRIALRLPEEELARIFGR
ncbi:MAG: DNA mismatch repair endonuclease MutL [Nitrospirota bacterium]